MRVFFFGLLSTILLTPVWAQEEERPPQKKPVLIRDDRTDRKPEEEVFIHDPQKAAENVEIGDFYFKRENYKAAADRYRDAVKYNLQWAESYKKLIATLEQQEKFAEALQMAEQFLDMNPMSEEAQEFQKKREELLKQNQNRQQPGP